jgi:hypothetical protein
MEQESIPTEYESYFWRQYRHAWTGTMHNPTNMPESLDELSAAGRDWRTLGPQRRHHPNISNVLGPRYRTLDAKKKKYL